MAMGNIYVLPIMISIVGFVLAVILRPILAAYGKAFVTSAIADQLGNDESLRILKDAPPT